MLEAYMDESGIHDGAHACVVAGYYGHENRWRDFEGRWREILREADEPTLKEFHSVDFWKPGGDRKGVFGRWSDAKADKFIGDLLDCIKARGIYPATSSLVLSSWQKLTKNERRFLTGGRFNMFNKAWITPSAPNQTYYLPFQFVVTTAATHCKEGFRVRFVFDSHKQFKNHASALFRFLKKDHTLSCRDRLGEFEMAESEKAPGLQAADLLAYQSYQNAKSRAFKDKAPLFRELPWILRGALRNMRDEKDHQFFNDRGVAQALQNLPVEIRQSTTEYPLSPWGSGRLWC